MLRVFLLKIISFLILLFNIHLALAQERILKVPVISLPPALGNPFMANGLPSALVWFAMFDPLVRTDERGNLEPALALSWERINSYHWRFKLRDDVFFSNGEIFDANAAASVFRWLIGEEGRGQLVASELKGITKIEVTDRLILDVFTIIPDAILPKRLTAVQMVAPIAFINNGLEKFALSPVGTGPFKIVSWRKDGAALFEANTSSWRLPKIDKIMFYQVPEETALMQSLQSGQLDIATNVSPDSAYDLKSRGFNNVVTPTGQVMALAINVEGTKVEALKDFKVRQALNFAIDRKSISEIVMGGIQKPAGQPGTPVVFGYNNELDSYKYDPHLAKELLARAGYPDGFELFIEVVVSGNANAGLIYQFIQQAFREVGVDSTLRSIVFSDWMTKYTTGTFSSDLFSLAWNSEPYYDVIRPMEYYSCAKPVPFFCHNSLTQLINEAGIETNKFLRLEKLRNLSEIFRELAPSIFILEVSELSVVSNSILNYRMRNRVPVYEDLEILK